MIFFATDQHNEMLHEFWLRQRQYDAEAMCDFFRIFNYP
jgi:hypothetical protein